MERVNDCIAGNVDDIFRNPLGEKSRPCGLCGGKVEGCDTRQHLTQRFFREGLVQVMGTQARLHMKNGDMAVKRGQGPAKGAHGVTLHNDAIRTRGSQKAVQRIQQPRLKPGETLARTHDIQFCLRRDAEIGQGFPAELLMLAGIADKRAHVGPPGKRLDDRRQLDGFGPCAGYDGYACHVQS